jgi:DivIVA domain-containing protein
MIDLTPLDVRKKRDDFKRSIRGYDAIQVDSFLDIAADRMEELVQSEARLTEQVSVLREQLDVYRERDRALNDALVTAQELREDARVQAEQAAELKLREANVEAQHVAQRSELALEQSALRLSELRSRREQFLRTFRGMLDRFTEEVEVESARLQEERAMTDGGAAVAEEDGEAGRDPPEAGGAGNADNNVEAGPEEADDKADEEPAWG